MSKSYPLAELARAAVAAGEMSQGTADYWLALYAQSSEAQEAARLGVMADKLLAHLDDGTHETGGECSVCGRICCPHGDDMHFHHDGCPSCYFETKEKQ